jgi:TPR repeat protein
MLKKVADQQGGAKTQEDACYLLADAYMSEGDVSEAVNWLTKASELGRAEAQCNLKQNHEGGRKVTQSLKFAKQFYELAAEWDSFLVTLKHSYLTTVNDLKADRFAKRLEV